MTIISAEELILIPLKELHADELYPLLQDQRIYKYIPEEPPRSLEALHRRYAFLEKGKSSDGKEVWLNWVLYRKDKLDCPFGTMQASVRPNDSADIAFIIFPEYWGKGYGRRASKAMINHIFLNYNLKNIKTNIDTRNNRSIRMVEAMGLQRVREIKNADHFKGQSSDEYEYKLSFDTWFAMRRL